MSSGVCYENGRVDTDCCAVKGEASCASGYSLSWGEVCYEGHTLITYRYSCIKGGSTDTAQSSSSSSSIDFDSEWLLLIYPAGILAVFFGPPLLIILALAAVALVALAVVVVVTLVALVISAPLLLVAYILKVPILALLGIFGAIDNLFNLEELMVDYVKGVTFNVHLAYQNTRNIYGKSFHILDDDQNQMYLFWLFPTLYCSTLLYDVVVALIYPIALSFYLRNPFYFVDEVEYRISRKMKPKGAFPTMIANMWDLERMLWFDTTFLKDQNFEETELTISCFLGPIVVLLLRPFVTIFMLPIELIWGELSGFSQLLMFLIYDNYEPYIDEFDVSRSAAIRVDVITNEGNGANEPTEESGWEPEDADEDY